MRFLRYGLGALAVGTTCVAVEACTRHEPAPGVLMLAIQTDMSAGHGKAIQAVGLYVRDLDRGRPLYALTEPVAPDGTVRFPATLAIAGRANPGASIRIRVVGFKDGKAQVMRDAVTTIPTDRVALFRLPIRWVNYEKADGQQPESSDGATTQPVSLHTQGVHTLAADDPLHDPLLVLNNKDCSGERTFVDGSCVSWNVDSSALPDFVESEVFGGGTSDGGGTCFDTEVAFAASTPAEAAGDCLFHKPTAPFTLAVKQGLGKEGACVGDGCYIPLSPESDEGWKTEGPNVRLSPGTCARMVGKPLSIVFSTKLGSMSANATLCGEASRVGGGTDLPVDGPDGGPFEGGEGGEAGDGGDAGAGIVQLAPGTGTAPTQLVQDATNLYYVTRGGSVWMVGKKQLTGQATRLVSGADAGAGVGADNYKLVLAGTPSRLVLGQIGSSTLALFEINGNPAGTITLDLALTGGIAGAPQDVYAISGAKGALLRCPLPGPGGTLATACTSGNQYMGNVNFASFVTADDVGDAGDQYIAASGAANGRPGAVYKHAGLFGSTANKLFDLADLTVGPLVVEPGVTGNVFALVPSDGGVGSGIFANSKTNPAVTNAIAFVPDNVANPTNDPYVTHEVYLHQRSVFWTNAKGEVIGAQTMLPTKVVPIAQGQAMPIGITIDAEFVYWTTMGDGKVWRAPRQNKDLP